MRICNPRLKGANWSSLVADRFDRILTASGPKQFEKEIQSLVGELHTSHTTEHWVFQDVHEGGSESLGDRAGRRAAQDQRRAHKAASAARDKRASSDGPITGAKPTSHYQSVDLVSITSVWPTIRQDGLGSAVQQQPPGGKFDNSTTDKEMFSPHSSGWGSRTGAGSPLVRFAVYTDE